MIQDTTRYVYIRSHHGEDSLWTVGFFRPNGKWSPESDHNNPEAAASRVAWLNGGGDTVPDLVTALHSCRARLHEYADHRDDGDMRALDMANRALAKARGEPAPDWSEGRVA